MRRLSVQQHPRIPEASNERPETQAARIASEGGAPLTAAAHLDDACDDGITVEVGVCDRREKIDCHKMMLPLLGAALLPALTQCNTLEKDIAGINARNAEIAREPRGNYFVGRRYHVPATRFWGYLDRKSTRLNSSHSAKSRMPSSA